MENKIKIEKNVDRTLFIGRSPGKQNAIRVLRHRKRKTDGRCIKTPLSANRCRNHPKNHLSRTSFFVSTPILRGLQKCTPLTSREPSTKRESLFHRVCAATERRTHKSRNPEALQIHFPQDESLIPDPQILSLDSHQQLHQCQCPRATASLFRGIRNRSVKTRQRVRQTLVALPTLILFLLTADVPLLQIQCVV